MTEQGLQGALSALDRALRPLGSSWMVIGGIAVIARGVSRHTADVEHLLERHLDAIDLGRVRRVVGQFAAALEEPDRVREFEGIVRRVADRA
jgi:hypothetical protein